MDAVSRTYGDANPAFTATAPSGALVGSDTVASLGLTLTSTAIATSNVGTYHVTGTASNRNYAVTIYGTNKLTVTAKPITVTVDPATRAYGDENPAFTATAPSSALVGEDTVASLGLSLTTAADTTSPVGSYSVTGSASNGNYDVTVKGTDALAVTQRAVTLTVNAASRIYGDANPDFTAELTGGTYAPGDSFQSLGLTLSTTADQTTGVGEYDVTGTASNTNYNVTVLGERKLTITQRPITVEVDAVSRTYGERNPNFTANTVKSGSLVKGDMLVLTLTTTADRTSPVGKYDVTLKLSDSPNYAVTVEGKDKLTVTAKPITVTVDPATRAYGEANPAFTATVPSGALVSDDTVASLNLTLSSDATATSPVGKYDVTGTANNGNYAVTVKGTDALAVTQRAVTLTVNAASRIYGDANPDFTAELTGGTYAPGDSFQSLGLTLSTTADQTTGVGEYDVTGTASNTNYNVTVLGERKLTITQRPITVEVDAVSRTYGERNPNFTANTVKSGSLVKGDMLVLTLTTTADRTSPVGKYDVTLKLSDSPNYAVTVEGKDKLTVTAKPITVTVDPATRAYGEANPAFTATVPSGALVSDDTVASLNLTLSSDATATSPVGKYDVTGTANNANYTVTVEGTDALTVEPKTITVTAENKSSRVGYELVELTYTYTPALLDGAAFNGKLATNANKDVVGDQYTITQGTLELNANYAIVFNAGKYTVTSKLTQDSFAFADSTIQKTYGDPDFTVAATGAEEGSNVTYTGSDDSIAAVAADGTVTIKKAGRVTITATASPTRDYAEGTARCTLIIDPAKLTVTALDKKITVYESAPDLTNPVEGEDYTVTGTLFGTDALTAVALSYAETPDTSKVGEYIINITATLANYDITTVSGTLTIEPSKSTQRLGILDGTRTVPGGTIGTSPKNALPGQTATITVTPQKGYELGGLTVRDIAGGQLTLTRESDREYTFVMPDSSVSVTGYFVREGETMFRDVPADAYYYEAVQWAVETGVTGGVGDDLFAPDAACTRAQIVTFLWRAAGSPEPQSKADFTDVPANAYYAKAVAWALENGITKGTSATTFSPDDPCTRAQAVTFLARALSAKAEGTADFLDVIETAYYAKAVAWASENSVTSGVGGKRFAPDQTCTRAQIVTFLYRAYNK